MDEHQKQDRIKQLRVEILKKEIASRSQSHPAAQPQAQPAPSTNKVTMAQLLGSPLLSIFPQTRPVAEALGQTSYGLIEGLTGGLPRQAIEQFTDLKVPTGEGIAGTVGKVAGAVAGLPRLASQQVIKRGAQAFPFASKLFTGKSFLQRIPSGAIEGAIAGSLFPTEGDFDISKRLDAAKTGAIFGAVVNPTIGSLTSAVSKGTSSRKALSLVKRAEAFKNSGQALPDDLANEIRSTRGLETFADESGLRVKADDIYNKAITTLRGASEKDVNALAAKWPAAKVRAYKYFDKAYKTIFLKAKDVDKNEVLAAAKKASDELVGSGSQLPQGMLEKLDDFILNFGSKQSKLVDNLGRPIGGKSTMTGSDLQTLRTNLRNNLSEYGEFGSKYADMVSDNVLNILKNNLDDTGKLHLERVSGDFKEFSAIQDFMRSRFGNFRQATQSGVRAVTPRQTASAQSIGMSAAEGKTGVIPQGVFAKTSGVQAGLSSLPKATAGEVDRLNQVLNLADTTNIPKLLRTDITKLPEIATKSNVARATEIIRGEIASIEARGAKVMAQNSVKLDRLHKMQEQFGKFSNQRTASDAFAVLTKGVEGWMIFQILSKLSNRGQ